MKLLVTGAWKCTEEQLNKIKLLGHSIVFMQDEKDALPCSYESVEAIICNGLFLHHPIEKFTNLRYIQLTSAGYDRVDIDYVNKNKIAIYNARGVYSVPMAEFAVLGVLNLYKQTPFFMANQNNCKWEKNRNVLELYGKTVCVLGCGSVGVECAKRFKAFGCSVFGIDLFVREDEFFDKIYSLSQIDDVLARADVVVCTLPLTDKTRYFINSERLLKMKNGSVLVNISRGAIVDEKALLKALDENIYGAVLDVFECEPLSTTNALWQKQNVIITPHNSFVGEGNHDRLYKVILQNLEKINE